MAIREGRWDCQYCGTIGILGRHKNCSNCGRSRPAGTKFYLADDKEIADQKLIRQAKIGPDWVCEFCGTSNSADKTICGSCQAPRGATTPEQQVAEYEVGAAPTSGDMTFEAPRQEPAKAKQPPKPAKKRLNPLAILGIVGGIAVLCIGIIVAIIILGRKDVGATVEGFSWERTAAIEKFGPVEEEDWSVPSGGRILSQSQEVHHTDRVLDHYETQEREVSEQVQVGERTYVCGQRDLGNGFFEDIECTEPVYENQTRIETVQEPIYIDVPVYETLYTYEVDKWVYDRTESASGKDHSPYWPRADLGDHEREGERDETYAIIFVDQEGSRHTWEVPFDEWQLYELNQSVNLTLNISGEIIDVEP